MTSHPSPPCWSTFTTTAARVSSPRSAEHTTPPSTPGPRRGTKSLRVCLPARPGRRVVQLGAPALQISRSNHISAAFGVAYTEPHGATTLSNWTDVGPKVVGEPRYPIRNCDNLCSPTTKCLDYTLAPAPIFAQFLIAPWTKSNHSAAPWVLC